MSEQQIKTDSISDFTGFDDKPKDWILSKAKPILNGTETYLLSFHDDGVVWGKVKAEDLLTSDDLQSTGEKLSPSPKFRSATLQECRLFNERGQLHLWRNGSGGFNGRLFLESENSELEAIEEQQVLWGTKPDGGDGEFTIVADGSEGLRHAFPQGVAANKFDDKKRPLRLYVKHYLDYDEDGCARIEYSRLVTVGVE